MTNLILAVIGIVVLTNFIYSIRSHLFLKRTIDQFDVRKIDDKFILENIVHLRTSQNVLYASIAIMTFVIAFLGMNLERNVTQEIRGEIMRASRVNLDTLKIKVDNILSLDSSSQQSYSEIQTIKGKISLIYDRIRHTPQKLYVVQGLQISKSKNKFLFSELKPIDGSSIPQFSQPPFINYHAYIADSSMVGDAKIGTDIFTNIKVTAQGIEALVGPSWPGDGHYLVDLWIYIR
ncbi:MAG: hypothetical protein HY088_04565 [Ignavibacteriales bacterium]|nr:hypothetical protein [Ignavibacteriales bacterium]